jgi:hypothetical protein
MANLLKDMYNNFFIDQMINILKKRIDVPNENKFKAKFKTPEWQGLELKQRNILFS